MSGPGEKAISEIRKELAALYNSLPEIAGGKAVTFFKMNFQRQGWVYNASLKKWVPRKSKKDPGRAILKRSGRLQRSIRITKTGPGFVAIGSDVPYAKIHNEGGTIAARVNVRGHVRGRFSTDEVSRPGARKAKYKKSRIGESNVKAHGRNVSTEMPQRQFLGHSPDVLLSAEREFINKLKAVLSKLKK